MAEAVTSYIIENDQDFAKALDRLAAVTNDFRIPFGLITKEFYQGKMITVTKVRISADISVAKVYLSIFPGKESEEVLEKIEKKKKYYRHQLAMKIKNQVKAIPELAFFVDDTLDYIDNLENLLD